MAASPSNPFLRALGVRGRDTSLLLALGGAYLLLNTGGSLGWLALTGRFLSRVGPKAMPMVYIAMNLATATLFVGIAFAGERQRKELPLLVQVGLYSLGLAVFVAFPKIGWSGTGITMGFLLAWLYTIVVEQEFWVFVSGALPVRLAKRLTPGVGALGTVGRLLGSFLVTDPLGWNSISRLLWLSAGISLAVLPALALVFRAAARHPETVNAAATDGESSSPPESRLSPSFRETVAYVTGTALTRRVFLLSLAMGVTLGTADYPLAVTAQAHFRDEEELAAFFGAFGAVNNLLAVLLQFLGTSFLIRRLPLRVTLAILPASMAVAGLLGAVAPGFYVAAAARFVQRVGVRVVNSPATNTLFNPVPSRFLVGARALSFSLGISGGFILSGVFMQFAKGGDVPLEWVFLALAGSGCLGVVASRGADEAYLGALVEATRSGDEENDRLAAMTAAIAYSGGSSEAPVLLAVRDPALDAAVTEAVERCQGEGFAQHLAATIKSAGPVLGLRALERLARSHVPGPVSRALVPWLIAQDHRGQVLGAARAAGSLEDPAATLALRVRLRQPGPLSRPDAARIVEALLRCADQAEDLKEAVEAMEAARHDADPTVRSAAVRAMGRLGLGVFAPSLARALWDPDQRVALAAARAFEWARIPTSAEHLERHRARMPPGPLADEVDRTIASLRDPHLAQVTERLGSFRSRERKRLAQSMSLIGTGRTLPLVAKALEIEWAPARAAMVRTVTEVGEEDFQASVEASLEGEAADGRREPAVEPLLDFCDRRLPSREHPVHSLIESSFQPEQRLAVEAFCEELLGEMEFQGDSLEMTTKRLELVSRLIGVVTGDASGFLSAFDSVIAHDPRPASAAIELIEAGAGSPALKRRISKGLETLRERAVA